VGRFEIIGAAFIAPQYVIGPYASAIGVDPFARWHGDDRDFGGPLPQSRFYDLIRIDTDPDHPLVIYSVAAAGATAVDFPFPFYTSTAGGQARDPRIATASRSSNGCVIKVTIYSGPEQNPLTPAGHTPAAYYDYELVFDLAAKTLTYFGTYTAFPWSELILRGAERQSLDEYTPSSQTLFDFFWPDVTITTAGQPGVTMVLPNGY
jgi:hypothetical protein